MEFKEYDYTKELDLMTNILLFLVAKYRKNDIEGVREYCSLIEDELKDEHMEKYFEVVSSVLKDEEMAKNEIELLYKIKKEYIDSKKINVAIHNIHFVNHNLP